VGRKNCDHKRSVSTSKAGAAGKGDVYTVALGTGEKKGDVSVRTARSGGWKKEKGKRSIRHKGEPWPRSKVNSHQLGGQRKREQKKSPSKGKKKLAVYRGKRRLPENGHRGKTGAPNEKTGGSLKLRAKKG